jgi:putative oxidoreductase
MERIFRGKEFLEKNPDVLWDALRVYLGIALFIKGVVYLRHLGALVGMMQSADFPIVSSTAAELAALVHVAGGLMLAFGVLTRLGAFIQIPNLVAAILFIHIKEGLFSQAQTLEFALLVLFLLVLYVIGGSGRWSVDAYFGRREASAPHVAGEPPRPNMGTLS